MGVCSMVSSNFCFVWCMTCAVTLSAQTFVPRHSVRSQPVCLSGLPVSSLLVWSGVNPCRKHSFSMRRYSPTIGNQRSILSIVDCLPSMVFCISSFVRRRSLEFCACCFCISRCSCSICSSFVPSAACSRLFSASSLLILLLPNKELTPFRTVVAYLSSDASIAFLSN